MKKSTRITLTALAIAGAFLIGNFIGKLSAHNPNNWEVDYCESEIQITDWNTDGNELSMMLSNGVELTANKSENIYTTRKAYVAFDEIADIECDGRGNVNIITNDGNVYTLFVTGEY